LSTSETDWLEDLRHDLVCITGEAAKAFWPSPENGGPAFFNYRLEHIKQVERDAERLLSVVGGDRDIVLASVWLHDRFQPVFQGPPEHGVVAAEWAADHLADGGFPAKKVAAVCSAIANHSSAPGTIPPHAHEARLLWDADKLSKLGVVNLLCTFFNSYLALDRLRALCSDPGFPEHTLTIEHLADAPLPRHWTHTSPGDLFYFAPSRRWAAERWELEQRFCRSLSRQVSQDAPFKENNDLS
jgi:hypothetical protein